MFFLNHFINTLKKLEINQSYPNPNNPGNSILVISFSKTCVTFIQCKPTVESMLYSDFIKWLKLSE